MKIITAILLFLACTASLAVWTGPRPALRVYDESGGLLATIACPEGFFISYIHSIHLTPVDEEFVVEDGGILRLVRMQFNQLSTGMPYDGDDGFSVENGRFTVYPNRVLKEIQLRVSPVPGHAIRLEDKAYYKLTGWAKMGGLLILRAAEKNLLSSG
ncbi:hypothetical protein MASR2M29_07500 [Spirochaetota bacterium]